MIGAVRIQNFKSIRDLSFTAKRVNLFIGEPNTGKSNVIEALALLSSNVHQAETFRAIFRFRSVADLFFDQQVSNPIEITAGERGCRLGFSNGQFEFAYGRNGGLQNVGRLNPQGTWSLHGEIPQDVRIYRFTESAHLGRQQFGVLEPPFGANLAAILYTNKELRRQVSDLFRTRGFRLEIKPVEMELLLAKSIEDELYSFPYSAISETWRRIVFYMAILETNKDAVLLLDEPEANTFPFYTTYLAERIALDETNQFFLTTHNPYVLSSIVGKTPQKDLAVFVTSMESFATKVQPVSAEGLSRILDYGPDAFLNLDKLVSA